MSIGDTFRDSSHSLAHYLYDPFWNDGEEDPRLITGLAVWAALRFVYPDPFIGIADAIAGDTATIEKSLNAFKRIIEERGETYDTDKERADWMALVAFVKAIDEHLTPLLPSVDWILQPYRDEAIEESKKTA